MKSGSRKLLAALLVILVMIGGVLAGHFASKPEISTLISPETIEQTETNHHKEQEKREREERRLMKQADYIAAQPSFGPLMHFVDVPVTFPRPDIAEARIPAGTAQDIAIGQDVVLYDAQHQSILPLGGKVTLIDIQDEKIITISLPEGTATDLLDATVTIITLELLAMQRLPLSAVVTDENGESFIWRALPDPDHDKKYRLERLLLKPQIQNEKFFVPDGYDLGAYDLVILNPDQKIKREKNYDLYLTTIDAPIQNPIDQAWSDYEVFRLSQQQDELWQEWEDCMAGKKITKGSMTSADGKTGNALPFNPAACGARSGPGGTDPMVEIFKALTNDPVLPASIPSGEGGSACATGGCGG